MGSRKHQPLGEPTILSPTTAIGHCNVCGAGTRFLRVPAPTKKQPDKMKLLCVNSRNWKGSKYHAKPTTTSDGVSHASTKEARRWEELKSLERSGIVSDLRRQVTFDIVIGNHKICRYIADFCYFEKGRKNEIVEDVKGFRTREYQLKKKLMRAIYNVEIRET